MCPDLSNKKYYHKGFTLLEILVSMLIFAAVALSISLPFCESIKLTSNNQNLINANNLAKSYLKSVEINWSKSVDFDLGILPDVTSDYTNNGAYNVTVAQKDLVTNSNNQTIIKRVSVKYKDSKNKNLIDVYMDYNRP